MKNVIREFLDLNEKEKRELCDQGVFVFDTNVLLNLYRYTKKTRETLLKALEKLESRIWMPEHVAYEFMKNRPAVIFSATDNYNNFDKKIEEFLGTCKTELRLENNSTEITDLRNKLEEWIKSVKETNLEVQSPSEDFILNKLLKLFEGKTGESFAEEEKKQIIQEGAVRYEKGLPPGYKDAKKELNKDDNNAYGDLIVWKQILRYAKENKKDIVFVTGDQKEDWWLKVAGRTVGPRTELRKEFFSETDGQKFHMYTTSGFLEFYIEQNKMTVDKKMIAEVSNIEMEKHVEDYHYIYKGYIYNELIKILKLYKQRDELEKQRQELKNQIAEFRRLCMEAEIPALKRQLYSKECMLEEIDTELNEMKQNVYEIECRTEKEQEARTRYYSYMKKFWDEQQMNE